MANLTLPRVRPTRTTLAVLVGLLWALSFGAVRDFVWADLRDGLLSFDGLSRVTRGLILLGFSLLLLMVGALLFNDLWRDLFPLVPATVGTPGRGTLLPTGVIPTTVFLLSMAWSFALTGAIHSHPMVRLGTVTLYLLVALTWIGGAGVDSFSELPLTWLSLVALVAFFALRWRAASRPVLEFSVLLIIVASTFAPAQQRAVESWRFSDVPLGFAVLSFNVASISALAIPLLLYIGVDIANFTRQASGWTVAFVSERLPRWMSSMALLLVFGWLIRVIGVEAIQGAESSSLATGLAGYAGALGVPLTVLVIWWLLGRVRQADSDQALLPDGVAAAAERRALPLILFYHLPALAIFLLTILAGATNSFIFDTPTIREFQSQTFTLIDWLQGSMVGWRILLNILALPTAVWFARRGHPTAALYFGIFGAVNLWMELTNPGRPLEAITWRGLEPVDAWWTVLFVGTGLYWLVQRRLDAERVGRLLFLAVALALLRQTDFIEDPFSPFFGFAGIGLVAFGVIWDALTVGSWANEGTRSLPRISRIFLYLGYVLFTVTVVNWALTSHNLSGVDQVTGGAAMIGLELFGRPLLYAVFMATLYLPVAALPDDDVADRDVQVGDASPS